MQKDRDAGDRDVCQYQGDKDDTPPGQIKHTAEL
jgi:hypothetical protein